MAKKLSGRQRRNKARTMKILTGVEWRGKRGRPKGETAPIRTRRGMIEFDFLWLVQRGDLDVEDQRWTDLMIVNELLLDDPTRSKKYKLGECKYRKVYVETLRRYITAARKQFFGTKTPLRVRT